MLIELPAADEIDDLAITSPKFEVRKFEFDIRDEKADLKYPPCKAQAVIVAKMANATALCRSGKDAWHVPSGRVGSAEEIPAAVKRVARDDYGLFLRSIELAGMYDVIWHYSDLTVKRLHFVYAGTTDEAAAHALNKVEFFDNPADRVKDEISMAALSDCSGK